MTPSWPTIVSDMHGSSTGTPPGSQKKPTAPTMLASAKAQPTSRRPYRSERCPAHTMIGMPGRPAPTSMKLAVEAEMPRSTCRKSMVKVVACCTS